MAIFKKEWGMVEKILSGEKTLESRWCKTKRAPWGRVKVGEKVYLKNSGENVCGVAEIDKIKQYENLSKKSVKRLLRKYYRKLGVGESEIEKLYQTFKEKKYCLMIYLNHPRKIKPFTITKKGFGLMASWITIDDIKRIKAE